MSLILKHEDFIMLSKIAALLLATTTTAVYADNDTVCPDFLDYDLPKLHTNETVNLCDAAKGKTLLIVNTASHCGYTKQFGGLEALHQKYKDKGLFVVGFTSNDFNQEADSEEEANRVCRQNFGVSFTMIAPSYVKGKRANPIFRELNKRTRQPGWNFNKYLVDKNGRVISHFSARVKPESSTLTQAIESVL
jgi:glutathione peroxidase